jgi:Tol biopolymer transport system component
MSAEPLAAAPQDPEPERAVTVPPPSGPDEEEGVADEDELEGDEDFEERALPRTDALIPKPPGNSVVRSTRLLVPSGGRLDWSVQGDWIAYDRRGPDDLYDLYKVTPQGAGITCLTCPLLEFRNAHALNPSWHPSGRLLVFQAQMRARRLEMTTTALTTPERGLHTELWTISADGKAFFQLTRSEQTGAGVLDPHFSHEGDRLVWSERIANRAGLWGDWAVRVAEFSERGGVPRLGRVRTYRPGNGRGFLVVHGFTPDDRQLVLSGNLEPGQAGTGLDLYLFDLTTQKLTRLTSSLGDYDDQMHYSPAGDWFAWASDRSVPPILRGTGRTAARPLPRDVWLMNTDGSGEQRLTFFNPRTSRNPADGAVVSDLAWSPRGDQLAVHVVRDFQAPREEIYLIDLDPGLGRGGGE